MSRVAKKPVIVPAGVTVNIGTNEIEIRGPKGMVKKGFASEQVEIVNAGGSITFATKVESSEASALAGTTRALVSGMVLGVSQGFSRKLLLVGVGFKAQAQGKTLNLALGFSHPVQYTAPEGVTIETPSQTEIIIKGADKHAVGQASAEIRAFRAPEPYKGKGIRYDGEVIVMKEGKKK